MTSPEEERLEIKTHRFEERVAAHHVLHQGKHIVGIDSRLPERHRRSRELQAHGAWIRGMRRTRRTYLRTRRITEIDPQGVRDISRVVEDMEPRWIEDVRRACAWTSVADEIVEETALDYDTVTAIVGILIDGGELPQRG